MAASFLPREPKFFDCFEKQADLAVEGAELLAAMLQDLGASETFAKRIKDVEHRADTVTHEVMEMLHKTFVTPFDREEIHRLASSMDDVVDGLEAVSERLWLYEIRSTTLEALRIAQRIVEATTQLRLAIGGLRKVKKQREVILSVCVEVNRIENDSDATLREALARLFREAKDPILVIKWKELYENLEMVTDRCEDVANVIDGVVLENA